MQGERRAARERPRYALVALFATLIATYFGLRRSDRGCVVSGSHAENMDGYYVSKPGGGRCHTTTTTNAAAAATTSTSTNDTATATSTSTSTNDTATTATTATADTELNPGMFVRSSLSLSAMPELFELAQLVPQLANTSPRLVRQKPQAGAAGETKGSAEYAYVLVAGRGGGDKLFGAPGVLGVNWDSKAVS